MSTIEELQLNAVYQEVPEGGYIAYVAGFPGANSQGETVEEAQVNLNDAISLLLECQ